MRLEALITMAKKKKNELIRPNKHRLGLPSTYPIISVFLYQLQYSFIYVSPQKGDERKLSIPFREFLRLLKQGRCS